MPRRLERDLEDKAIMKGMQEGDAAALGLLFERCSRLVLSVALRILRDRTEAQDVLQDVFCTCFGEAVSLIPRGDPSSPGCCRWRIPGPSTDANSLTAVRPRRTFRSVSSVVDHLSDPEMAAQRLRDRLAAGKIVHLALREMTKDQCETLLLHFFEGYSLR